MNESWNLDRGVESWNLDDGDPVADLRAAIERERLPRAPDAPTVLTRAQYRLLLALGARLASRRRRG